MSRVGRHGAVYGLGVILNKAVSFIMLPVYTRFMTPADYGALQLIIMTHEVAAIIAGSRIAWGIMRFYHKAESDVERRHVVTTAFFMLASSFAVVAVLEFAFAGPLAAFIFESRAHTDLLRIAAVSLAFEMFFLVPMLYLQIRHRSGTFVRVSFSKLVVQASLNVVFLVPLGMGAKGVVLSGLLANATIGTWLVAGMLRDVGVRGSTTAARDLLRFGIPLVGMQVATFILAFGDRYFLNRAVDTSAVGIYGLAYQFGFVLVLLGYEPFSRVWDPTRFEIASRNDRDVLYARGFVYMNLLLVTMAVGMALFVGDFLRAIADPAFHGAATLVPIILTAYVVQCWTNFLNLGIMVRERTEYLTLANWLAAGVAVGGYVWLIPELGGMGAALATLVAFVVRQILVYGMAQRLWPVRYRWGPVARLCGAAMAVTVTSIALPQLDPLGSLAVHVGLLATYAALVWHLDILSLQDRAFVRRFLRSPRAALSNLTG